MKEYKLDQEDIDKLHEHILEMFKEFDRFCNEHKIKYVIEGGTLLGAVRNGGFIPWDDDADIAMTREEYEKLKKHCHELNQDICYFQDHDTDHNYLWGYGKLRKTGTTLVRAGQEHIGEKTGVFIDIFPMDDIPRIWLLQLLQYFFCIFLQKILWARVAVKRKDINPVKRVIYRILCIIPDDWSHKCASSMSCKSNNRTRRLVHNWGTPLWSTLWSNGSKFKVKRKYKYGLPKEWYLKRKRIEFEDTKLWAPADSDGYLTYVYGDYMNLPPEEKRVPQLSFCYHQF